MKEVTVNNYSTMAGDVRTKDGNTFTVKSVVAPPDANQCTIAFVEVDPGNYAFGYHYHEMNEEAFYIVSGEGIVRTPGGEIAVKAGDIITFPTGPKGAHVMRNSSETEKLIFIDFDTRNPAEIVHFPDLKKVMAIGPHSRGSYDENE